MKKILSFCFGIIAITSLSVAVAAPQRANNHTAVPWHAVKRTAHETEWASTSLVTNAISGKVTAHDHKYIELGTGLNHQDRTGAFQPSSPNFEITPNGAEAPQGQHQVFLAPDISSIGAVEIVTPDGIHLKSAPVAIGYFDPTDGRSVLLSAVVNGTGWLTAPNEVIYSNCFANIRASIRYRNSLAGIAQDLILHEQPPPPEAFGLSPLSRLEFLTEFADDTPEPAVTHRVVVEQKDPTLRQAMAEPDLTDSTLTFGQITLGAGKAFAVDAQAQPQRDLPSAPVAKQFIRIEGRKILVESAEHHSLAPLLRDLPAASMEGISTNASLRNAAPADRAQKSARAIPEQRLAHQSTNKIQMALKADPSSGLLLAGSPAVVIDYEGLNNGSANNKTLLSDMTYLVTGTYNLNGTTTIEGGTVVKYDVNGRLNVNGPIVTKTSAYRPAVFTAKDDHTAGEAIGALPISGYYANPALSFTGPPPSTWDLPHVRIMYAQTALYVSSVSFTFYLSHSQIFKCLNGIDVPGQNQFYIRNVLFSDVATAFRNPSYVTFTVENSTFNLGGPNFPAVAAYLVQSSGGSSVIMNFKNCILARITSPFIAGGGSATLSGEYNGFYSAPTAFGTSQFSSGSNPFAVQGAGKNYLVANSSFRNVGTTTINVNLLADLRERTTTAPNYRTSGTGASTTWSRDVARDVDALDLGYHYPAVDYLVSGWNMAGTGPTLTVTNGATIAIDYNAASYGIQLTGSRLVSTGDPKQLNRFVGANAVQEAPFVNKAAGQTMFAAAQYSAPPYTYTPYAKARFTEFSQLSSGSYYFYVNHLQQFAFRDCQFFGGAIYDWCYVGSSPGFEWYNNLFEKVTITAAQAVDVQFHAVNNNFVGGSLSLHLGTVSNWEVRDNIFDGLVLTDNGSAVANSHNAYRNVTGAGLQGASQTFTMTDTYVTGPLGKYYLPTASALRNVGDRTAAAAGLFHHTSLVDQTKEAATTVDIGFHYVALNPQGYPFDTDADLIPDYVEDQNGNGTTDFGETSWTNPDSDCDSMIDGWELTYGLNPLNSADAILDPDSDLLDNRAEYLAGTHPTVADTGYIPNNRNGQNWPATMPYPPPANGSPHQEREYTYSFNGLTLVQPNDGVARAIAERIDNVLINALLPANRANWDVYAALQPFAPGTAVGVHNIVNPNVNANYMRDEAIPTHTAFMDIYFETGDNLNYIYNSEARMRQRYDNTERWLHYINGGPPPTAPDLNNRIEFMSKIDRTYDALKPGWSEVTESRNRDSIPHLPASGIQSRIDRYQDGRWPADLELFRANPNDPAQPSPDANKVGNFAWNLREYLVRKLDVPFDFACPATYSGSLTYAVGAGDFNGDGRPDVAMANFNGNNVTIYLCNANGTFTVGSTFSVGANPNAIAVADFNQDTRLDLAVVNQGLSTISVLIGNGNGTFAAAVHYNVGQQPMSIAVGNFNADLYPDLVVANYIADTVSVLLNNGNGTFAPAVNYTADSAGSGPFGVTVGDFNGDGRGDIAWTRQGANLVGVRLANANGTFGSDSYYAVGSLPRPIATGDFNGDGRADLAMANGGLDNNISVLLGNGNGTFAPAVNYTVGTSPPLSIAVADFNGDRRADIAVTFSSGDVGVLKGNGNGTFAAAVNFTAGIQAMALAAADFNADGFLDLAVGTLVSANSLKVLLNEAGTDVFKLRPKVVVLAERRRQHFSLPGLLLSFVPGVALDNVFIITIDANYVYDAAQLIAFMRAETTTMPPLIGSFLQLDVEFERDTAVKLDEFINDPTRTDHADLVALRNAFLSDQDTIIALIAAEFNNKPHDLTEFYSIKGAAGLVDLSSHAQVTGSGLQGGVAGILGNGLSFNGNGYVSYVAQAQSFPITVDVDNTSPFVLTEFQTRGGAYPNNGENWDAIQDENGAQNDWIEIQNVSATAQSLSGWRVSDSVFTYEIPAGITVPAGGFAIVFADDGNTGLHANFGLRAGGEAVTLRRPTGNDTPVTHYNILNTGTTIPVSQYDVSFGIARNGNQWVSGFFNASPRQPNEGIYQRVPMDLGNADFTISLWIKTSAANVAILGRSDTDTTLETGEKQLYLAAGKVRYIAQGASTSTTIAGSSAINNNTWRHIAVTYTLTGNLRKIYVDGVDNTDIAATTYTATADAAGTLLHLGFAAFAGIANFSGSLDDVAIWARALPATEINAIYTAGGQGTGVNTRAQIPAGLLFHASMDVSVGPQPLTKYHQAVDFLP